LSTILSVTKRDGNKITEIEAKIYGTDQLADSKSLRPYSSILHLLMPDRPAHDLTALIAEQRKASTKGDPVEITTYVPTWEGDNITKFVMTSTAADVVVEKIYAYNNKNNPYRGLTSQLFNPIDFNEWGSANNPGFDSTSITGEQPIHNGSRYTYEYEGQWPTQRTHILDVSTPVVTSRLTTQVYYEYKN